MATRFDRSAPASGPAVTGFVGRGFKVDGEVYAGGVKLTPVAAQAWVPPTLGDLTVQDLDDVLALQPLPEFLLLGTGAAMARPSAAFAKALDELGVGLEAMDSRAAARAWAVLRAEDRWIVAALMPL